MPENRNNKMILHYIANDLINSLWRGTKVNRNLSCLTAYNALCDS